MSNAIGVTTANWLAKHWSEPTMPSDKKPEVYFSELYDIANLLRNHTNALVDDSCLPHLLTAIRDDNPEGDDWKNPEIEITENVGGASGYFNDFDKKKKWTLLYKNEEEGNDIFRFNWTDELKEFIKAGNIKGVHLGGLYESRGKKLKERRVSKRTIRLSKEAELWSDLMDYLIEKGIAKSEDKNVYPEDGYFFRWCPYGSTDDLTQEEAENVLEVELDVSGDMYHLNLLTYTGTDIGIWEGDYIMEFIDDFDELQREMESRS